MPVVKKTVAVEPIIDNYIRKMWATLIEGGYDASYSTALNYMLLEHILSVAERGITTETKNLLNSFLNDEGAIQDLNLEDYAGKVDEYFANKKRLKDGR